jgi:hypothetical protein
LAFDFVNNYPFQIFKLLKKNTQPSIPDFFNISESENRRFKNLKEPAVFRKGRQEAVVSLGQIFCIFRPGKYNFHTQTHTHKGFFKRKNSDWSSLLNFFILISSL